MGKVTKIYPHGDSRRYQHNNCRCDPCRQAASRKRNREWFRLHHGSGPATVDSEQTLREVHQLVRSGMAPYAIATRTGLAPSTIRRYVKDKPPTLWASTRDKIHLLWQDVFGENGEFWDPLHPKRAKGKGSGVRGPAIWPRRALREKYLEKHKVMTGDVEGRLSDRHPLMSTVTAEKTAIEFGFMPHEVWEGWSGRVEAV